MSTTMSTATSTEAAADLLYRAEASFTDIVPIGPVSSGFRMNGHFAGTVTHGDLAGAALTGVDFFRIRHDGVGVVRAHEVVTLDGQVVAVELDGLLLPPQGVPAPTPHDIVQPGFAWPTEPYTIHVTATFETAIPGLAELNRTVVAHSGAVNFSDGSLVIEARRVG